MINSSSLVDNFGRDIKYLRLSVTDRCNLRCTYCMAEDMQFSPRQQILSIEEMIQLADAFIHVGIEKIRLTGGEPLVRNGLMSLIEHLGKQTRLREMTMTTNGILLPKYAASLVDAGMQRINISLDSLDAERFKQLTRWGELNDVLKGIAAAQRAGFKRIKLNAVVLAGENDHDVVELANFALNEGLDISFIEEMPLGLIDSHQRQHTQIASQTLQQRLQQKFQLQPTSESTGGPSRYFSAVGFDNRIGFISPMTNNFCDSCNRIRVTTEGRLLLCLGNEHSVDLRHILRQPEFEPLQLTQAIVESMNIKPEKHDFDAEKTDILRFMSTTGG